MQKNLVWVADRGCGGFGDRMVGLVSAHFLARASGRRLWIWWKHPDMKETLRVRPQYKYQGGLQGPYINWIDKLEDPAHLFTKHQNVFFSCNQYLHKHLATPEETRKVYQSLFTEFFEPSMKEYEAFKRPCGLAFQVRFGDHQIRRWSNSKGPSPAGLAKLLKSEVGTYLKEAPGPVYLASDCDASLCIPLLGRSDVVSHPGAVEHLDRTADTTRDGMRKLLVDFMMMMECCDTFLIPWHSNLSRVAVLASSRQVINGIVYLQRASGRIECLRIDGGNYCCLFSKVDPTRPDVRIN